MNTPPKRPTPNIPSLVHIQNTTPRIPAAPPVYRPQPVPKVLQTKRPPGQIPQPHQPARPPAGPPVYRPQVKTMQPKVVTPQRPSPPQPPVYRPQPPPFSQPSIIQRSGGKKTKEEEEKKARRRGRYTRIIRLDQLNRRNIGVNTTRKSRRSLQRNLPEEFAAKGKHRTRAKGLYSYMRRYGGAGIQGVHRGVEGQSRAKVVHGVLSKMAQDPNRRHGRRGPKFAMIGIDPTRLNNNQTMDTTAQETRNLFAGQYGGKNSGSGKNYMKMYDRHAAEGVVAVLGGIPLNSIMGLRSFRNVPTEDELEEIIEELVMSEEEDDDILTPDCSGGNGFNFGSGFPPPPGSGSGPGITT